MNDSTPETSSPADDEPHPYDELEDILGDISARLGSAPQWEYCDGFLAALICCRREIHETEYLPVMLRAPLEPDAGGIERSRDCFASGAQRNRFMRLWTDRWLEAEEAIETDTYRKDVGEELAYHPAIADLRGRVAKLPPEERAKLGEEPLAAFALPWAVGFMDVVGVWAEEWVPPRDREMRKEADAALAAIEALIEDDTEPPTVSPYDPSDPPSVGKRRFAKFFAAQLAVHDLYDIFHDLGPRTDPVRKEALPGRNDPCWCGSGKKFKKCHGA